MKPVAKRAGRSAPEHVPTPVLVAVLAKDEGNALRLVGGPRLRRTIDGKRPLAGSAGLFKLVLLDTGLLPVSSLLGRDVDPLDADDLGEEERARLALAMAYALEDLQK